jgi:tetratricopeptide (TPR) repeat protein
VGYRARHNEGVLPAGTDAGDAREIGLASYYVAHAYERLHAFEQTPSNLISGDVLLRLANAESIFAGTGDRLMLGRTYTTKARYLGQDPERASQAADLHARAQRLLLEAGATAEVAELLNDAAAQMPFTRRGDPERALDLAERTLDLARQAGDLRQMARAASTAGEVLLYLDRLEDSLAAQDDAVGWSRVLADPAQLELTTNRRGTVLYRLGRYRDARSAFAESVELAERLNVVARQVTALTGLGMAEEELGELDAAASHYGRSGALAFFMRRPIAFGNAQVSLARVASRAGHPEQVKSHALSALFWCEDAQWPSYATAIDLLRTATGQLLRSRYSGE